MKTRTILVALLLALAVLTACTPKELITSVNAQEPCAFIDGRWSSANCESAEHDEYVFVRPEDERPVPLSPEDTEAMLREMFG